MAKQKSKMIKIEETSGTSAIVALYLRVSTDKQREEGYSLDIQEERLLAFTKTMEDVEDIRLYKDDGYSGGSLDRPAMQRLISDVEDGIVTHVVVVKLDRLSRSQKDTLHLIEDVFIPNNVAFISIQESFNTNTPFGRAMMGILSVFAQLERENIYERTRSGMQKRVEAGFWPGGGHPPFGYDYNKEKGILVPNSDAEKVRYLYDKFLDGASLQQIADDIGLVYEKNAYNILTRKTNAGFIVYNDQEYKGQHEPIISLDTYNAAMTELQKRASKKLVTKTDHLLTGLLVCGVCGAKMRYQKWGSDKWKLVCYSRQKSKPYLVKDPNCDNEYADPDVVEDGVLKSVFAVAKNIEDPKKSVVAKDTLEILNQQREQEVKKLKRLYALYAAKEDDVLLETISDLQEQVKTLEEKIEAEERKRSELADVDLSKLNDLSYLWEYMEPGEKRAIVTTIINSVKITHDRVDVYLNIEV